VGRQASGWQGEVIQRPASLSTWSSSIAMTSVSADHATSAVAARQWDGNPGIDEQNWSDLARLTPATRP
jgi:hypothetical protein